MKYILLLLFMLIPTTLCGDEIDNLRKAIDHEMQSIRQQSNSQTGMNRGKLLRWLNSFGGSAVGFRPIITVLPSGVRLPVGVVISHDRRYVRIGLSPMFSTIGEVHTFNFGR